jgi:hypothetical protein
MSTPVAVGLALALIPFIIAVAWAIGRTVAWLLRLRDPHPGGKELSYDSNWWGPWHWG